MSATWEIQKSLYNTLKNDSTFMGLINNRIYDEPPTNSAYPYVLIGDCTEISDNRLIKNGYEVTATFFIYTKDAGLGYYKGKQIYKEMNRLLNVKKPSLDTLNIVICQLDNMYTDREDDKRVISVRYRVIAHDNNVNTF